MTEPNWNLLRQAAAQAAANPEHFYMRAWVNTDELDKKPLADNNALTCNTTLCLAGWVCYLSKEYEVIQVDSRNRLEGRRTIESTAYRLIAADNVETNIVLKFLFHNDFINAGNVVQKVEDFIQECNDNV